MRDKDGLTPLQARYVAEYIADPTSATQAAIRAGYSPRGANVTASQVLAYPSVQTAIARKQAALAVKVEASREFITAQLLEIAALREHDRIPALIGAARILGYIVDRAKVEHTGEPLVQMHLQVNNLLAAYTPAQIEAMWQAALRAADRVAALPGARQQERQEGEP